ncbi:MAG: restriction endonuclease subunit S [Paludibacteraceae bacterium]|nr:restriction endonuclease subunit S [Paludibacteraceae bacterium]
MKEGWEIKKLGEIAYIGLGFTHTPEYVDKGVPFLSVKDISSGEICWEDVKYVTQEEFDSAPKGAKPQKGDIMFCRVGTMGKPVIVTTDKPFCTFVSLGYLRILKDEISNVYIKFWMQSNAFDVQVKANVKGVAIKNLNTGWLKDFTLPVPPLGEQERIVGELDCLSGVIEKKKEQLKDLDLLAQSIFYEMFGNPVENDRGWEVEKLGDVCQIICGQDYKSVKDDNGKYPIYGTGGIMGYASQYRCPANSVIIGRKGNINNPLFVDCEFWNVDTAFGVVPDVVQLAPMYFFFFCKNYDFTIHDVSVTIPSLRRIDILKIDVACPPLSLQQEFASKIEAIEKQKELIRKSIGEVEMLFNSRMDYYFG